MLALRIPRVLSVAHVALFSGCIISRHIHAVNNAWRRKTCPRFERVHVVFLCDTTRACVHTRIGRGSLEKAPLGTTV